MHRLLILIALAFAPAAAAVAEPIDEVIAAERAFAAYTREHGFREGFLAYVAPDGFTFEPGPVQARPRLEALPEGPAPGPPLFWWPQFAGIARSGDLGFTSGGATIPVRYFTVWQRQSDGGWKWIYDGGTPLAAPDGGSEGGEVARLPASTNAAASAEAALAEGPARVAELARAAADDAAAARLRFLAEEALVSGSAAGSLPGREHHYTELARQPAQLEMRPLGTIGSGAGDMVFAWGQLRWSRDGTPRWGHYARIWQSRAEGWRIVADVSIPAPGVPPA